MIIHGAVAGGGGFVGPLDLLGVPAIAAYSNRALSSALLGGALYTLRRSSDDTTQVFNCDLITGAAPVTAINAFKGVGNVFNASWRDQSNHNYHVLQATAANQPQWQDAQFGAVPGFTFDGVKQILATAGNVTLGATLTIFVVAHANNDFDCIAGMNSSQQAGDSYVQMFRNAGSFNYRGFVCDYWDNDANGECGPISQSFVSATPTNMLLEAVYDVDNDAIAVNGINVIASNEDYHTGPVGVALRLALGADDADSPAGFFKGVISEFIIFDGALTDEQRASVRANIAAYYGIALPNYQGPLDISRDSVISAFGVRAMSASLLGQQDATLHRASDDTEQPFGFDTTTGFLPVAAIEAFLGGTGSYAQLLDQAANYPGAISCADVPNQPQFTATGPNGCAGLLGNGTHGFLSSGVGMNAPNGSHFTAFIVFKSNDYTDIATSALLSMNDGTTNGRLYVTVQLNAADPDQYLVTALCADGNVPTAAGGVGGLFNAYDDFVLIEVAIEFGSHSYMINGVALTELQNDDGDNGDVPGFTNIYNLGSVSNNDAGGEFRGIMCEQLLYGTVLDASTRTAIRENIAAAYGISLG